MTYDESINYLKNLDLVVLSTIVDIAKGLELEEQQAKEALELQPLLPGTLTVHDIVSRPY